MPININASTTSVVSLDDLKRHLRIPDSVTKDDYELGITAGAAVDAVEGIIGPILHRTVTETVTAHQGRVVLSQFPVVSVTALTHGASNVTHTLDGETGLLSDVGDWAPLSVTYVAGRTSLPDAVALAVLIIARHLWDLQRGNAPSNLSEDEFNPQPGIGYAIPSRAQDLLAPYARPPVVA